MPSRRTARRAWRAVTAERGTNDIAPPDVRHVHCKVCVAGGVQHSRVSERDGDPSNWSQGGVIRRPVALAGGETDARTACAVACVYMAHAQC